MLLCTALIAVNIPVTSFADTTTSQTSKGYLNTSETAIDFTVTEQVNMSCQSNAYEMTVDDIVITNNSGVGVLNIDSVQATAANSWSLVSYGTSFKTLSKDAKKLGIAVNNKYLNTSLTNLGTIRPEASFTLDLSARTGISTQEITNVQAATIVVTLSYVDYDYTDEIPTVEYFEVTPETQVLAVSGGLYKVSDSVLKESKLTSYKERIVYADGTKTENNFTSSIISETVEDIVYVGDYFAVIYNVVEYDGVIYTPGIYMASSPTEFVGQNITNYLAGNVPSDDESTSAGGYDNTMTGEVSGFISSEEYVIEEVSISSDDSMYAYKIHDGYMSYSNLLNATATIYYTDGTTYTCSVADSLQQSEDEPLHSYFSVTDADGNLVSIFYSLGTTLEDTYATLSTGIYSLILDPADLESYGIEKIVVGDMSSYAATGTIVYDNTITGQISGFKYTPSTNILGIIDEDSDDPLYKIHNGYMTYEQLLGNTVTITLADGTVETVELTEDLLSQITDQLLIIQIGYFFILTQDVTDSTTGEVTATAGIYSAFSPEYFTENGIDEIMVGDMSSYIKGGTVVYDNTLTGEVSGFISSTANILENILFDEDDYVYKIHNGYMSYSNILNNTATIKYTDGTSYTFTITEDCIGYNPDDISQCYFIVKDEDGNIVDIFYSLATPITNSDTGEVVIPAGISSLYISSAYASLGIESITVGDMSSYIVYDDEEDDGIRLEITPSTSVIETVTVDDTTLYKVSNDTYSLTEVSNMVLEMKFEVTTTEETLNSIAYPLNSLDGIVDSSTDNILVLIDDIIIVQKETDGVPPGIYFTADPSILASAGISSVRLLEYLPGIEITTSTSLTTVSDGLYKICDGYFNPQNIYNLPVVITLEDGTTQTITLTEDDTEFSFPMLSILDNLFINLFYGFSEDGVTITTGLYTPIDIVSLMKEEGIKSIKIGTPKVKKTKYPQKGDVITMNSSAAVIESQSIAASDTLTITYNKYSNAVYTKEELIGGTIAVIAADGTTTVTTLTEDNISVYDNYIACDFFLFVSTTMSDSGATLTPGVWTLSPETFTALGLESGTYFVFTPPPDITVNSSTTFTETKALSSSVVFGKYSSGYYTAESFIGKTLTITTTDGTVETIELTESHVTTTDYGIIVYGEFVVSAYTSWPITDDLTFTQGVWVPDAATLESIGVQSLTIK